MYYDILIIGQGLAGTLLSYFLFKNNINFLIIDDEEISTSKVCAGLISPIGGKRFLLSNSIDKLLPFAIDTYKDIEKLLNKKFLYLQDIVNYFNNEEIYDTAIKNQNSLKEYLQENNYNFDEYLNTKNNSLIIKKGGWLDTIVLLDNWKKFLKKNNLFFNSNFKYSDLIIKDKLYYKDFSFNKIIFCEGYKAKDNPFFNIPFQLSKGEIITIKADLPKNIILKKNSFILNVKDNIYKVGSTYQWDSLNFYPTLNNMRILKNNLEDLIKKDYRILDHIAGIRPTVRNRDIIIEKSEKYKNLFIFNGLGTKGITIAPYYSNIAYQLLS